MEKDSKIEKILNFININLRDFCIAAFIMSLVKSAFPFSGEIRFAIVLVVFFPIVKFISKKITKDLKIALEVEKERIKNLTEEEKLVKENKNYRILGIFAIILLLVVYYTNFIK